MPDARQYPGRLKNKVYGTGIYIYSGFFYIMNMNERIYGIKYSIGYALSMWFAASATFITFMSSRANYSMADGNNIF